MSQCAVFYERIQRILTRSLSVQCPCEPPEFSFKITIAAGETPVENGAEEKEEEEKGEKEKSNPNPIMLFRLDKFIVQNYSAYKVPYNLIFFPTLIF